MDKPDWDTINRQGRWPKSKVKVNISYLKLSVVTICFFSFDTGDIKGENIVKVATSADCVLALNGKTLHSL